jgi:hypothetical protein
MSPDTKTLPAFTIMCSKPEFYKFEGGGSAVAKTDLLLTGVGSVPFTTPLTHDFRCLGHRGCDTLPLTDVFVNQEDN